MFFEESKIKVLLENVYGYKLRRQGIFQQSSNFNNIPGFSLHNHTLIWQFMGLSLYFKIWSSPR